MLGRDWGVNMPAVEFVVMGHVDIPCMGPQTSYLTVLGLKCHRQAVDTLAGCGELLGSDGGPSFNGGGETKGHHMGDLAELLLAEMDKGLGRLW